MGSHENINADKFPKQGKHLNKKVSVCFHYNTKRTLPGAIVRDDIEEPFLTIVYLYDTNNYVLGTECQYQVIED